MPSHGVFPVFDQRPSHNKEQDTEPPVRSEPVRYGLFIVQRQMWMPVCTANVTHKTESHGISAVLKCSVDINEKKSVHSWNGLVTTHSPCPPKKYIHIFRFVSPNVNTCEWCCAKRCCTLLILTIRKLHPCNWQLWTIYNVESFHSEPLVLHVGNICEPPPGKTRRCQQCGQGPCGNST